MSSNNTTKKSEAYNNKLNKLKNKGKNNIYERLNMDKETRLKSLKYTEAVKKTSSTLTQVTLGFILAAIIGYTGYLCYDLSINVSSNERCKNKPSATDASFTCPQQNQENPVYYKTSNGREEAGMFYGAIERPNF